MYLEWPNGGMKHLFEIIIFFCNCVHFMPEKTVVKNPIALGASWGGGRDEDIPVPSSSEAC